MATFLPRLKIMTTVHQANDFELWPPESWPRSGITSYIRAARNLETMWTKSQDRRQTNSDIL